MAKTISPPNATDETSVLTPRCPRPFESLSRELDRLCPVAAIDVSETDKAYQVTAELPGVNKTDVEVKIDHGGLTIKGKKRSESAKMIKSYHRRERCFGSLERTFTLPDDIDVGGMEADFKNGVLTVTLPKCATKHAGRGIVVKTA
jgi:HSP20 family protein